MLSNFAMLKKNAPLYIINNMIYWVLHKPLLFSDLNNPLEVTPAYFFERFDCFTFIDIHRFSLCYRLENHFYNEQTADLCYPISKLMPRYIEISNIFQLTYLNKATSNDIFVFQDEGSIAVKLFLKELNKRGLKSLLFAHWKNFSLHLSEKKQKKIKKNLIYFIKNRKVLFQKIVYKLTYLGIPDSLCFDYCFCCGEKFIDALVKRVNIHNFLPCHSVSYDKFLSQKGIDFTNKYILFIDEALTIHPDNKFQKITEITEAYQNEILTTLRHFKKETGFDIVVANHPRLQYPAEFWMEFQSITGKTTQLMKNCQFVLGHESTALQECFLCNKDVVLLTSSAAYFQKAAAVFQVYQTIGGSLFDMHTQKFINKGKSVDFKLTDYYTLLPEVKDENKILFSQFLQTYNTGKV